MSGVSNQRAVWLAQEILPHEPMLRSWLRQRKSLQLDVDDVVQESYAVLAGLPSVEHIKSPRAYLFTVAHSIVQQYVRRMRIVPIETMAEIDSLGILLDEISPERRVQDHQELRRLAQMIGGLPAKCRQVFTLRKVEGLSQRAVARRVGISESTVEKHMARATRLLMNAAGEGDQDLRAGADGASARNEGTHEKR